MSKIVILRAQLGMPQINSSIDKIRMENPPMADFIANSDTVPLIKECAQKALERLYGQAGIKKGATVTDYYGNPANERFVGIMATGELPKGLGVIVRDSGMIEFAADSFRPEWKEEIRRLQALFADAFIAELTAAIMEIMACENVTIQSIPDGRGGFAYNVAGEKQ